MAEQNDKIGRRGFMGDGMRVIGAMGLTGAVAFLAGRKGQLVDQVWQIDPDKCMACSNCQTYCVLDVSAVKAVQCFAACYYCDECTGYFPTAYHARETGAENHLCPTGAIVRKFVEQKGTTRFCEYSIDESSCIGCGKCVVGCRTMKASLYLQVRHDRCLNCNECAIAIACPTQAFCRVPADAPHKLTQVAQEALERERRKRAEEDALKQRQPMSAERAQEV